MTWGYNLLLSVRYIFWQKQLSLRFVHVLTRTHKIMFCQIIRRFGENGYAITRARWRILYFASSVKTVLTLSAWISQISTRWINLIVFGTEEASFVCKVTYFFQVLILAPWLADVSQPEGASARASARVSITRPTGTATRYRWKCNHSPD